MLQVTERCMIVNMVLTTHHARFASRTVLATAILMQVRVFRQAQRNIVCIVFFIVSDCCCAAGFSRNQIFGDANVRHLPSVPPMHVCVHVLISGRWLLKKPECDARRARRQLHRRRRLCLHVLHGRPMVDLAAAAVVAAAAAEGGQHHGAQ